MSLRHFRRHAGQLLFAGFPGPALTAELRAIAREFDLGGAVLFARNVEAPEQVAELAFEAQALGLELPAWVAVDQEGGRVARLKAPLTEWPPMVTLGRTDGTELAARFAKALALELRAVGITFDFAPVLDVATNPKNPVIGDRALSDRPERVAELGRAIVEALQAEGIAACGKHFPGHGDTTVDSHHELPVVEHGPDRLRQVELVPFKAAIAAGVAAIMTAHVLVPSLDERLPATLSPAVLDLLRGELAYDGLVLTDDLDMRAVSDHWSPDRAASLAIAAGCDGVLVCGPDPERQVAAIEGIIRAAEAGELAPTRVESAMRRQRDAKARMRLRARAPVPAPELRQLVGRAEHAAIAEEMARFA